MLAYSLMKLMSRIACVQPTCFNDAPAYALGQIGWLATPKWRRYMAKENVKECLGVSETEDRTQSPRRALPVSAHAHRSPALSPHQSSQF